MSFWILKHTTILKSPQGCIFFKKKKHNFGFISLSKRMISKMNYIASLDQGTSSTRMIIYDQKGDKVLSHQVKLPTESQHPGYIIYFDLFKTPFIFSIDGQNKIHL